MHQQRRDRWIAVLVAVCACTSPSRASPSPKGGAGAAVVWQPFEVELTSSADAPYPQPQVGNSRNPAPSLPPSRPSPSSSQSHAPLNALPTSLPLTTHQSPPFCRCRQVWSRLELNATLTHAASGTVLSTPGFWDGGKTWRVRFSCPLPGRWAWRTSFSVPQDTGLANVSGAVDAAPYQHGGADPNPLYQHGVLRPSANNRYLEHADGTPFYWLGDTHWSGFSTAEHWNETNNPSVDPAHPASMLKQMVDVRARQGYSVWKGETFVVNGAQGGHGGGISNAGGEAWGVGGMYGELRPQFWRAIDDVVAYINSRGMVVSLAFAGIGRGLTDAQQEAPLTALARYAVARYAGFHTVWTTCQEYCSASGGRAPLVAAWGRVAASQYALDPHKRSTSLHNCYQNPRPPWQGASWFGHATLQQSHFVTSSVDHWIALYNYTPTRTIIEDEVSDVTSQGAVQQSAAERGPLSLLSCSFATCAPHKALGGGGGVRGDP